MGGSGPLTGRRLLEAFPANGTNPLLMERYVKRIRDGGSDEVEIKYDADGVYGWYRNACVAIGHDRVAVSYRDITERKKLEEELRIVSMEFRHRLKNVFAVVAALVKQSAKTASDIDSLAEDIRSRIFALSAAQGLLHSGADHCSLVELTREILDPFAGPRLVLEPGPEILLRHEGLVSLALALNELATNAIKFGALSNDTGQVTVGWTVQEGRACLAWREEGGPTVEAPNRCGLGTRLIDDAGQRLPGGKVAVEFAPTGLVAKICLDVPAEPDPQSST